jgi:acetyltransferase-like isoleucine patch superfamily enzyme
MRFLLGMKELVFGSAYWLVFMLGGFFFRRGLLRYRGRAVKISPTAFLKYPGNISIGHNSFINHNCCVWAAPRGTITIGDDVLFGPNVCVTASNHGLALGVPIHAQPGVDAPIVIGNDVWLGANVVVTAGVEIGDGCVVGAGSVVTKSLPPYSICGGVPAKVLSMRA